MERIVIELATESQLFLDDRLIADSRNLTRVLQQPVKHPANPLLVGEHPWEARAVQCYGNALYDAERGCFRFWYFAAEERDPADVPRELPEEARQGECEARLARNLRWIQPWLQSGVSALTLCSQGWCFSILYQ